MITPIWHLPLKFCERKVTPTEKDILSHVDYQEWLSCIIDDDDIQAEALLASTQGVEKWRLVNGRFDHPVIVDGLFSPTRPLCLAIVHGSLKIVSVLIKLIEIYRHLRHMMRENMEKLLKQENDEGYWPLEMASDLGLATFVKEILDTPEVYKAKVETRDAATLMDESLS